MKSSDEARTISRERVVNKLRELGYTFKERKKCIEIWRKAGSTHRVLLDTRKQLSPLYVRGTFMCCKVPADEIEAFVTQNLM